MAGNIQLCPCYSWSSSWSRGRGDWSSRQRTEQEIYCSPEDVTCRPCLRLSEMTYVLSIRTITLANSPLRPASAYSLCTGLSHTSSRPLSFDEPLAFRRYVPGLPQLGTRDPALGNGIWAYHFLLVVCSNNGTILHHYRYIPTFTVYVIVCDLEKSFGDKIRPRALFPIRNVM